MNVHSTTHTKKAEHFGREYLLTVTVCKSWWTRAVEPYVDSQQRAPLVPRPVGLAGGRLVTESTHRVRIWALQTLKLQVSVRLDHLRALRPLLEPSYRRQHF